MAGQAGFLRSVRELGAGVRMRRRVTDARNAPRTAMRIAPRTMLCCLRHPDTGDDHPDLRFAELLQLCEEAEDKVSLASAMAGMLVVLTFARSPA